ncbi:MAG: DUF3267 domain-containing protein [Bacteroidetes bacterium]|nr:MAG: DUF3267 domain-containing protein [Bacteroidota bacterium]
MRQLTIESTKANLMGIVFLLPVVLLFGIPFYFLWHQSIDIHNEIQFLRANVFWILLVLVIGIAIHELLHGLAYLILTKGDFKNISFGILWKDLTPYCHYSQVISVKQYRIAVLLPGVITGLFPLVIALLNGSFPTLILGMLFTLGAIGDLVILWIIRKEKSNTMIKDHPDKIGCIILEDN